VKTPRERHPLAVTGRRMPLRSDSCSFDSYPPAIVQVKREFGVGRAPSPTTSPAGGPPRD